MTTDSSLKDLFLEAPASEIDPTLRPMIEGWDNPDPKALQVLEVLNKAIHAGLASGFAVGALQAMYAGLVEREGTTHEEIVKLATWRND